MHEVKISNLPQITCKMSYVVSAYIRISYNKLSQAGKNKPLLMSFEIVVNALWFTVHVESFIVN